jgi:hypothetical protein
MERERNVHWEEFVSFISFILLGRLFKTNELLKSEEIEQLKIFEAICMEFVSNKYPKSNTPFLFHFKECLYLIETDFESKVIREICEGNLKVDSKESLNILKMRISNSFSSEKQHLSRYVARKSLSLSSNDILANANFFILFNKYLSLVLITYYFSNENSEIYYDFEIVDSYFNLMIELNKNQIVENDSLFNNCIEKLSVSLVASYSKNWKKASEIMINLEDQQIAVLCVYLFPLLFPKMNSLSVVNPYSMAKNKFSLSRNKNLLNNEFLRFHFGFLDIPSFVKNPKILKLFFDSAKTPSQIRKMYQVAFPIAWESIQENEEAFPSILNVFFGDENQSTSVNYLHLVLEKKNNFYSLEEIHFNEIVDRYMNHECMESLFFCLSEILNPSLSLYVIQKLKGIDTFKSLILDHLSIILNYFSSRPTLEMIVQVANWFKN